MGIAFLWFLLLGPILNVLIRRTPRAENMVSSPSQPGVTRRLGLVALFTAGTLTYTWKVHGGAGELWPYLGLTSLMIVISFIDLDHLYIPDVLLKAGLLFWLACFIFTDYIPLTQALFGAAVGFGTMYLIYYGSRGRMGLGDVKFAGLIGLYLGPALTGFTLVITFILSALVGVFLLATKLKKRKDPLPFGPFFAIGAYVAMLL